MCACVCFSDVPKVPYCPESGQCSSGDDFAHLEQRAGCAWSGSYLEHSSNSPREWPANKCCTPEALGRVLRLRDSPRLFLSTVPLSAATCKHQHRPGLRWSWSILPALPPTEVAMTASPAKPRALTWYCRLTLTRLGIRFSCSTLPSPSPSTGHHWSTRVLALQVGNQIAPHLHTHVPAVRDISEKHGHLGRQPFAVSSSAIG